MSDDSLDRRVAEIVGWTRASAHDPTDCIEDAIAALEAMREKGWSWELSGYPDGKAIGFWCELYYQRDDDTKVEVQAETLPLAICKAIVATQEGK